MVAVRQSPMVGRAAELCRLVELARLAVAGRGAAICIDGEAGIGKTTLLDALAAEATRLGLRVRRATADESTQRVRFATLTACLGVDPRPAASSGLGDAAPASLEFAWAEAMIATIEDWCATAPLLLLLDDLHWIDPSSLRAVRRVSRALGQLPLLLVTARRPGAGAETTPALPGSSAAGTLRLGPLADAEAAELLGHLVGASPGPRLRAAVAEAAGNPGHLTELVSVLAHRPGIRVVAGTAEPAGPTGQAEVAPLAGRLSLPSRPGPVDGSALDQSVLRRIAPLSTSARRVLRVAAVLGPELDRAELAAVLGRGQADLVPAIREVMDAGILGGIGEHVVFRQDMVREALLAALPAAVASTLHQTAARTLIATGASVERVARHLLAGGTLEPGAVRWLRAAMDPLIARAPELAVDLLHRALVDAPVDAPQTDGAQLAEPTPTQLDEVQLNGTQVGGTQVGGTQVGGTQVGGTQVGGTQPDEALGSGYVRALLMAGRPADAERMARARLNGDSTRGAVPVRWLLAHACLQQGRPDVALAEAQRALARPGATAGAAARLHGVSAQCLFLLGRMAEAEAAAGFALAADPSGGDELAERPAGPAYLPHRHPADALAETEQALSTLPSGGLLPDQRTALLVTRGCCLEDLDRLEDADREFERGRQICERGDTTFLVWFHVSRARLWFFQGRWDDALAEIEAGREPADPLGLAPALDSLAAMVAVHRGELPVLPESTGGTAARCFDHLRRWVAALSAEAQGRPDRALDLLAASWEQGLAGVPPALPHRLCPDLARLAVTLGDRRRAREVADGMARFAEQRGTGSARGTAELCRGLADSDPDALLAAAESFRLVGRPLFRAYAQENAAVVLGAGAGAAARQTLDSALELYGRMGAGWDAHRAEGRAQEAGVRPSEFGLPSRPRTGWGALTGTERAVATRVADGRSNPDIARELFRSRRTVQWHVRSILAKLELSSRAELAEAVSRRRRSRAD